MIQDDRQQPSRLVFGGKKHHSGFFWFLICSRLIFDVTDSVTLFSFYTLSSLFPILCRSVTTRWIDEKGLPIILIHVAFLISFLVTLNTLAKAAESLKKCLFQMGTHLNCIFTMRKSIKYLLILINYLSYVCSNTEKFSFSMNTKRC